MKFAITARLVNSGLITSTLSEEVSVYGDEGAPFRFESAV
jgi:hypothetical protein